MASPHTRASQAASGTSTTGSRRSRSRSEPLDIISDPQSQSALPAQGDSELNTTAPRSFDEDASIVLVGIRGTGKSSIGIIASTVFKRRLLETKSAFQDATGNSSAVYRKSHGPREHERKQLEVLRSVLRGNEKGCIIICGLEVLERNCHALLREYSKTHPVIHVVRDEESIHGYLKTVGHEKIRELLRASGSVFRSCSNYDFFNVSNTNQATVPLEGTLASPGRSHAPFLTLKKAERHFLKFVALITAKGNLAALEAAYPLSHIPVELRPFTYVVSVPLSLLSTGEVDRERVESGSDAFEIVIDNGPAVPSIAPSPLSLLHHISRAFAEVRHSTIVPLIYHVDYQSQHLGSENSETSPAQGRAKYLDLVRHGLRLAPEFITVDLRLNDSDILRIRKEKGSAKLIGHLSYVDDSAPNWDQVEWMDAYKRAARLGCDLVRLSRPIALFEENFAVRRFRDKATFSGISKVPLVAYNTGTLGRLSAVFNQILTTVTHASLPSDGALDRPCITARECTEALSKSYVFDPMRFWIIGARVGYSLSPAMHNAAYALCGLPHKYKSHQTPTLANIHDLVNDHNFGGASVAVPFKIEILTLTHSLSAAAEAIGAVNTLIPARNVNANGSIPDELSLLRERNRAGPVKALYGENTDWIGIRACIRRGLSPVNAVRPQTTALVIGAGGMARAAVYSLIQLGVQNIFIHNRTLANAERLAAHYQHLVSGSGDSLSSSLGKHFSEVKLHILNSRDTPWPSEYRHPTIHVCCVPTHSIGSDPAPNFTMPTQWLKSPTGGVVLELAYMTLHTPLLEQIRAESHRGWVAMDGLDLLPEQAFAQFELFTGKRAPRRLMRKEVLRNYRDSQGMQNSDLILSRLALIDEQEP